MTSWLFFPFKLPELSKSRLSRTNLHKCKKIVYLRISSFGFHLYVLLLFGLNLPDDILKLSEQLLKLCNIGLLLLGQRRLSFIIYLHLPKLINLVFDALVFVNPFLAVSADFVPEVVVI